MPGDLPPVAPEENSNPVWSEWWDLLNDASSLDFVLRGIHRLPHRPRYFIVSLRVDIKTLIFTLSTVEPPSNITNFNVYFVPIELVSPSTIFTPEGARAAFRTATQVTTTGPPNQTGVATATNTDLWNIAGYFFATAESDNGESDFTGPVVATTESSLVADAIPPEVSGQTVTITPETTLGQAVRLVTCSAIKPSNVQGVVQVDVANGGAGYTSAPDVVFDTVFGSGAVATAVILGGAVVKIIVSTSGFYTSEPLVTISGGGGAGATAVARVGESTAFAGYQIYIKGYGYLGAPLVEGQWINSGQNPGQTLSGSFHLLPDGHNTTFYFVSISPTGARRTDPTGAPSVNFAGGIG